MYLDAFPTKAQSPQSIWLGFLRGFVGEYIMTDHD
jgi:hypothetical protein